MQFAYIMKCKYFYSFFIFMTLLQLDVTQRNVRRKYSVQIRKITQLEGFDVQKVSVTDTAHHFKNPQMFFL